MSLRPSDRVDRRESPRHRQTVDLTGWIGVRNPPTPEPMWRWEPPPPSRTGAGIRAFAWVGEKRTSLVAGAFSIAMVGVLVGSSFHSPVTAEALQPSTGAQSRQVAQPPHPTATLMSEPAKSPAPFAVAPGTSQVGPAFAGVSSIALAANAVRVAASSGVSGLPNVGKVSPVTAALAALLGTAPSATPATSPSPAPSPSPARPVVPVVAMLVVPMSAAEQTAADAAAAAALTAANALAAANLTKANALAAANRTAANAKAAADLTAANAAAAAAATAKAAADAAWAVAHP